MRKVWVWLKRMFWTSLVILVLLSLVYIFAAKQVGTLEARWDAWRGNYQIRGYGLFLGPTPESEALANHGIQYRLVAGCVVNQIIIDNTKAYNTTMKRALKARRGLDVDQLLAEAAQ